MAQRINSIVGGQVLLADASEPAEAEVTWSGDTLCEGVDLPVSLQVDGDWVLPGIVDVHGDAFERSLMPRPGVFVDLDVALVDNDAALLASGITTSFLSATDSWEPGLRSRVTLRRIIDALAARRRPPHIELHLRHERCNTAEFDELIGWVSDGVVAMLSLNDHTPGGIAMVKGISHGQIARSGIEGAALQELLDVAISRRHVGMEQERELAKAAGGVGCVMASHDPSSESDLDRDLELGVAIAEFPFTTALAHRYRRSGLEVLLGAPNLVRGRSHLGNLSVRDAVADRVDPLLCSDYHYPSLLQAPFVIAAAELATFGHAWSLVSSRPASAAGLVDRGRIEVGAKADLVVVTPPGEGRSPVVSAVIVDGIVVYERR